MQSIRFRLLFMLMTFASAAFAQGSTGVTAKVPISSIYITHVTVIDTLTGKELPDRTVIISGDRISEVTADKSAKPPSDAQVLQGKGKYLIPGLWDMHVHAVFPER